MSITITGATLTGGSLVQSGTVVTTGLQLYLDAANTSSYAGSGTIWNDISGNSNNVAMQNSGSITYTSSGGGYFTTGANGYFNKATSTGVPTGTSPYSLCAWVQFSSTWGSQGIVAVGSAWGTTNGVNALRTSGTNVLLNYWWANDYSVTGTLSPTTQWFNCVAQWDGATRRIWINGTQIGSSASSGLNVTTGVLNIGVTNNTEYLNANIGQVLIYNRAITSDEISQNYSVIRSRYGV